MDRVFTIKLGVCLKFFGAANALHARQAYRDFYHKRLELTGAAHRVGVKVLVGTVYIVAEIAVYNESVQLVMAGL